MADVIDIDDDHDDDHDHDDDDVDHDDDDTKVRFFNSPNVLANFTEHTRTLRLYPRLSS